MIDLSSGYFDRPHLHHKNWFRVFRFKRCIEIWVGHRWVSIQW